MRVPAYLSAQNVAFAVRPYPRRYASPWDPTGHLAGHVFTQTVVIEAGGEYVMLVLPAADRVDLARVGEVLGAEPRLATEAELARLFVDCDFGAEPPFGSQYRLQTLVDERLAAQDSIAVCAGNHREVVLLQYEDYARLEHPRVAGFSRAAM